MSVMMKTSQPGTRFAPYVPAGPALCSGRAGVMSRPGRRHVPAGPAPQRRCRLAGSIRPGSDYPQLPNPADPSPREPRRITVNIANYAAAPAGRTMRRFSASRRLRRRIRRPALRKAAILRTIEITRRPASTPASPVPAALPAIPLPRRSETCGNGSPCRSAVRRKRRTRVYAVQVGRTGHGHRLPLSTCHVRSGPWTTWRVTAPDSSVAPLPMRGQRPIRTRQ